jgi:hypothetical protein
MQDAKKPGRRGRRTYPDGPSTEYVPALELDHVLIAVADLTAAGREFEARFGLASIEGGRHPGWGTANRIVPLGDAYLELISVVDRAVAEQTRFGRWVAAAWPHHIRPLGWAVRTDDVNDVAGRLGLPIQPRSRARPDGTLVRWRLAGLERAAAEPSLPFFIEWEGTPLPGRSPVIHPGGPFEIERLRLQGDPDRLADWLGSHRLPIEVRPGPPAVESVVLTGEAGGIAIAADPL